MVNRLLVALFLTAFPAVLHAQYEDPQAGYAGDPTRRPLVVRPEPIITNVELRGPLPAVEFRDIFKLTDSQAELYRAVLDSFNVLTKADRESANRRMELLGLAVVKRDSAAAVYYADQLKKLGKVLRGQQSKFDDKVKKLLDKDQQKAYKDYRKKQDEDARKPPDEKRR